MVAISVAASRCTDVQGVRKSTTAPKTVRRKIGLRTSRPAQLSRPNSLLKTKLHSRLTTSKWSRSLGREISLKSSKRLTKRSPALTLPWRSVQSRVWRTCDGKLTFWWKNTRWTSLSNTTARTKCRPFACFRPSKTQRTSISLQSAWISEQKFGKFAGRLACSMNSFRPGPSDWFAKVSKNFTGSTSFTGIWSRKICFSKTRWVKFASLTWVAAMTWSSLSFEKLRLIATRDATHT